MDFLQNWQELVAGFLSGVLALIGVVYSLRRESARQILSRHQDQNRTSSAVQEWYYGKIVDLKNYLFSRCFEIGRLFSNLGEDAIYTVGDLKVLTQLQIDAMTGADAPPDLLSEALVTQFSEVENSYVRGLITILATQTSRFLDADRYTLYEFRAALDLHDPEQDASAELSGQFRDILKGQLNTNRTILRTADEALGAIPWRNDFIAQWQDQLDEAVQSVYGDCGLDHNSVEAQS